MVYGGMIMIRIAIVEDEKEYVQILYGYLKKYEEQYHTALYIKAFDDGLDIASDYRPEYDIILMDIQMKHMDGMRAAQEIRKLDEEVIFIFITTTVQYAVQGYLVDALGYVLKPVPYLAFSQIFSKAVKQLSKLREKEYLNIEIEGGLVRLDISQITYIESQRHDVLVHTENGDYLTAGPLKNMEQDLARKGFAKCHNAYLVNLRHACGILQNDCMLTDGARLPVSRTRKKAFLDALADYIGGVVR